MSLADLKELVKFHHDAAIAAWADAEKLKARKHLRKAESVEKWARFHTNAHTQLGELTRSLEVLAHVMTQ